MRTSGMTSRSEPADSRMRDPAPPASTMGASIATLLSTPPAENTRRGVSGVGGGGSRSILSSRVVTTSESRIMRENSIRGASTRVPASNEVSTRLQSSQNNDEVNRAPASPAIGTRNVYMALTSYGIVTAVANSVV